MIKEFFSQNLDIVFFAYGLAFYVMGVAISIQPRKEGSSFELSNIIWLLGAFGYSHGLNEWLDMFTIIKGYDLQIWYLMRVTCLTVSFVFLFEFGRKLISISIKRNLSGWITVLMSGITVFFVFRFKQNPTIWPRYLLGLPGGLMSAFGFLLYYNKNKSKLKLFGVGTYFLSAAASIGLYGILTGVVVPKGNFPPASFLNNESFINLFKIPVQMFRAICAAVISRSIWNILSIFNREIIANLEDSVKKLAQSEHLAVMGKFADIMGHEFRNQLAVMKSSLYFINMKFHKADGKTKHHLETLESQITESNSIIEDILMFARSRKIDFKDVNLYDLLYNSLDEIQKSEKINVITQIDKDLPIVKGDGIKLSRCFSNLALNAVQAMESGGKLLVSADKSGNSITILFKDTGCGIKAQDKDRLFEPFYTTKKSGTGLGLATCRIIVEAHKGSIDINSEFNKGTTVKIILPITQNFLFRNDNE